MCVGGEGAFVKQTAQLTIQQCRPKRLTWLLTWRLGLRNEKKRRRVK